MAVFKRLKWLWIILFNLVIIVVLLEVILRLAAPSLPPRLAQAAYVAMTGQPYPQTWTPAWQENGDHYYILRPGLENDLQYGSPSVSFHVSTVELWDGGGVGFRTRPVDYFVDAVVVGDSFTFCFTEIEDCWVTLLGQQTGMGIVNMGQPATGSISHGRILRDFGAPLTPPLVIWQAFGNDFNDDYGLLTWNGTIEPVEGVTVEDIPEAFDNSIGGWLRTHSVAFAVTDAVLGGGQSGEDDIFTEQYHITIGDTEMGFGQPYELRAMDMSREANQIGYNLTWQALAEAQQRVAAWNGQMVIVVIPTREQVYAPLTAPLMGDGMAILEGAREALLSLCFEQDLLCYDPLPLLMERAGAGEILYYSDDIHLNPHGNAVLAEGLASWLAEHDLLPTR